MVARSTGSARDRSPANLSLRDPDRRQLRQLPVQRGALEHRRARRQAHHPGLGQPAKYEGVADNDAGRPTTGTRRAPPARQAQRHLHDGFGFPRVTGLLDASRVVQARGPRASRGTPSSATMTGSSRANFPHTLPLGLISTSKLKVGLGASGRLSQARPGRDQTHHGRCHHVDRRTEQIAGPGCGVHRPRMAKAEGSPASRSSDQHFTTTGSVPVGHGFAAENRQKGTAYYTFDKGPMRASCSTRSTRTATTTARSASRRWPGSRRTCWPVEAQVVMIFSHHTSGTMDNGLTLAGLDLKPRVLGPAVVKLLLANPNVIAWVNGHTHRNQIWAHNATTGGRRLLGDQHGVAHRLPPAVAPHRARGQPRRLAVDLHHDGRPRRNSGSGGPLTSTRSPSPAWPVSSLPTILSADAAPAAATADRNVELLLSSPSLA